MSPTFSEESPFGAYGDTQSLTVCSYFLHSFLIFHLFIYCCCIYCIKYFNSIYFQTEKAKTILEATENEKTRRADLISDLLCYVAKSLFNLFLELMKHPICISIPVRENANILIRCGAIEIMTKIIQDTSDEEVSVLLFISYLCYVDFSRKWHNV